MRNSFFLFLFYCLCATSCGEKQSNGLLSGKTYAERFYKLRSIAVPNNNGHRIIDSLNRLNADKFKDQESLQMALAEIYYSDERFDTSSIKEAFLIAAVEKAKEKNWDKLYSAALQELADYIWVTLTDKNKALQYYNKAYLVYTNFNTETFPEKFKCLFEYGAAYYSFEEYDRAISLLNEAISLKDFEIDRGLFISAWNTLGLCYRAKGDYEKALEIFNAALVFAEKHDEQVWKAIVGGNIGTVYFFLKRPDEAKPLLEAEVLRGTNGNDWKSASTARLYLAEIELDAGNTGPATEGLNKALEYSMISKQERTGKTLKKIYDDLAIISRISGDYRQALLYTDSARTINERIQKKLGANILLKAQNQIDQATFTAKKEATGKVNRFIRNGLIAGIILLAIVSILFFRQQRIKHLQRQKMTELEKEKIVRELKTATLELNHFAQSIEEKNRIIEEISQLQTNKQQDEEKYEILSKLERSVLLTDEQWNEFTSLFEKVYGNFLIRLKEKMPSISPAEIRIITLARLQLSNKTMAGMLGITPDAVRMNKFRIRKKLNLEEEADFEKFLESV